MDKPQIPKSVSIDEAAELLGASIEEVQGWIDSGQLRATAKQQIKIRDLRAFRSKQTATDVPKK